MGGPQVIVVDTHIAVWMTTGTTFGKRSMSIIKKALVQSDLRSAQ